MKTEAEKYVRGIAKRLEAQGVRARGEIRFGLAANVLLDVAEEADVSLIALSTHGRGGLSRWVFGSVAEKVIRALARGGGDDHGEALGFQERPVEAKHVRFVVDDQYAERAHQGGEGRQLHQGGPPVLRPSSRKRAARPRERRPPIHG